MLAEIKKIVPEAFLQRSLTAQIIINLPNKNTDNFPNLFSLLESNKTEFCIKSMGLSCTTMEEVFLRYL